MDLLGNSSATNTFISKDTARRIISDIKEIRNNPLTSHGIHYQHDESNLLKGQALIIGQAGTPYADGFYLFNIKFPPNYPHLPPAVEFCTHDGETRFNPNLYRSGKVCLSILNTWQGEQWSGCQTISSVLLAICTVLNDSPLLNEPGLTKSHKDFDNYNKIIAYKNIKVAMLSTLSNVKIKKDFACFVDIMQAHFQKNKEAIRLRIVEKGEEKELIETGIYSMQIYINYASLLKKFD